MQPREGHAGGGGGTGEEDGAESWSSLLLDRGRGDSAARLRAAREHYEAGAISAVLDVWRGARWAVLGGTALLVLLLVLHTLFLKMILHELPSHAFFVNQWSTLVYAVLITATAAAQYWYNDKVYTPEMWAFPKHNYWYIALLCAASDLLFTIGASEVPGSLLNMMRQLGIPLTIALSYMTLGTRFNSKHWIACALIMFSVVLSFGINYKSMDWELTTPHVQHHHHHAAPMRMEDETQVIITAEARAAEEARAIALLEGLPLPPMPAAPAPAAAANGAGLVPLTGSKPPPGAAALPVMVSHSHTNTQLLLYGSLFILGLVPNALLMVKKEYIYKAFDMDVVFLSAWVSCIQVVVSFVLVPLAVTVDVEGPRLSQIPSNFLEGLQCVFDPKSNTHFKCPPDTPMTMLVYNGLTFGRYLVTLMLLKYGGTAGSVLVTLATTLSLPLTNICFQSTVIMGSFAESPKRAQYMCTVLALSGMLCYAYAEYVHGSAQAAARSPRADRVGATKSASAASAGADDEYVVSINSAGFGRRSEPMHSGSGIGKSPFASANGHGNAHAHSGAAMSPSSSGDGRDRSKASRSGSNASAVSAASTAVGIVDDDAHSAAGDGDAAAALDDAQQLQREDAAISALAAVLTETDGTLAPAPQPKATAPAAQPNARQPLPFADTPHRD